MYRSFADRVPRRTYVAPGGDIERTFVEHFLEVSKLRFFPDRKISPWC